MNYIYDILYLYYTLLYIENQLGKGFEDGFPTRTK